MVAVSNMRVLLDEKHPPRRTARWGKEEIRFSVLLIPCQLFSLLEKVGCENKTFMYCTCMSCTHALSSGCVVSWRVIIILHESLLILIDWCDTVIGWLRAAAQYVVQSNY